MWEYDKVIAEAKEVLLNDPGQKKIDILLADAKRREIAHTPTDAGSLARLEERLVDLSNEKCLKSDRKRALVRCAAVTLHKLRHERLTDDELAEICNRCAKPEQARDKEELDKICETCPLRKVTV